MLTLEFSLPKPMSAVGTQVKHVFPSSDSLPENLLRFYVCFSNPMQRGRTEEQITLLGPDGRPAPDTLYRPPVELWDRSMRHLTILVDPGRLKRRVGPNRELGPPLKAGQKYTLAIAPGMIDSLGRSISEGFLQILSCHRGRPQTHCGRAVDDSASREEGLSIACAPVSKTVGLGIALAHDQHHVRRRPADRRSDRY